MKKRIVSIICALALCLSLLPATALAGEGDVTYWYYDTGSKEWTTDTKTSGEYTTVTSNDTAWGTSGQTTWYVVSDNVTNYGRSNITVSGTVNLILTSGKTLTLNGPNISLQDSSAVLNIYGQAGNSGTLSITAGNNPGDAGINLSGGALNIHSGTVTAKGYATTATNPAPGIDVDTGTLTVYGGSVTATAGTSSSGGRGAGIRVISGGTVAIHGGNVNAKGASYAVTNGNPGAGIGGNGSDTGETCGNVTITGGTVTATGGNGTNNGAAAGIGGGAGDSSGQLGGGGTVTISGGTVTASGGSYTNMGTKGTAPGIGGAVIPSTDSSVSGRAGTFSTGTNGSAVITATDGISDTSKQNNWQGIINNTVYGTVTLPDSQYGKTLTVSENAKLTIPDGATLTSTSAITVNENGTLTVEEGSTVTNSGTIAVESGGTLNGGGTIQNTGSGKVTGGTGDVKVTYPSTVAVTSDQTGNTAAPNQEVTFTAKVSGSGDTPTGSVQFKDNGSNLGGPVDVTNGKATYTTSNLGIGEHKITAEYTPDGSASYTGSSGTLTFTVVGTVTGISVQNNPSTMSYTTGQTLNLSGLVINVTYEGGTSTTVTWSADSGITSDPANGATLSASRHSGQAITITYKDKSAETQALTVNKANQTGFAFTESSPKTVTYSPDGTFTVTATGGNGDGEVTYAVTTGDAVEVGSETGEVTINHAGEATITATKAGDGDYNEATATLTVTVNKAVPTVTVTPAENLTYTGEAQALITAGTTTGGTLVYSLEQNGDYTETIPTGIEAKTYTVWYKVNGDENYSDTQPASVSVTIGKAAATVTAAPQAVTGLTYDGQPHALVTAGTATGGTMQYSTDGSSYSTTIPTGTDAGNYTVWYKVAGDGDHSDTDPVEVKVTIAGVSITGAEVSIYPATGTYNGSEQKPTVTVTLGEKPLSEGTDYTVAYTDADGKTVSSIVNAGTYTVTVTGKGNYSGSPATADFTIQPAALTITGATLAEKTYDGTTDATVTGVTFDQFTLTKDSDYTVTAVFDSANAGTDKTANVTVTLSNGNYTLAEPTYRLTGQTIEKADITIQNLTGYVGNGTSSLALPTLPDGAAYGEATYSGSDEAITDVSVSGSTLSYTGSSDIADGSTYEITVPVDGGNNYNNYTITVNLTGTSKTIVAITGVTAQNGTYDGKPQAGYTGEPAATDYDDNFEITYSTGGSTPPTNAGSYTVTISIPDDADVIGSLVLNFTIEKAALTVTAPSQTITVGDPIPDLSSLGTADVSGLVGSDAFSGVTLDYEGSPSSGAAGSYAIVPSGGTFSTGDEDNYIIQYVNGTLTVQAASTPVDPVDPVVPGTPDTSHSSDDDDDDGYSVSVPASSSIRNGSLTVSPRSADKGDTITITVKPDQGYVLETLTVTTRAGAEVALTPKGENRYTFTMPAGSISVQVSFVPETQAAEMDFADVTESYWAHDEIAWAYENGYMNGVSAAAFNPGGTVSRQQVWMILARMAGADPADMAAAKAWAVASGISDGTSPGAPVTRQQLAALLYRYAVQSGYDVSVGEDTNILSYTDFADLSEYAIPAMQWACGAGILNGTGDGSTLSPQGSATRAQLAVMLYRWLA